MTLSVIASGCILLLTFGTIGPLRPHDAEYTLELQLQLHCLALELIVSDSPRLDIIAPLRLGMWLVVLLALSDHAFLVSILNGWLMRLLEICNGFCI